MHLRQAWLSAPALLLAPFLVTSALAEGPASASVQIQSAESEDSLKEAGELVVADTTRAIVRKFLASNPDAREHKVGLISEAFQEDPANPALKLHRMWVGAQGVLLEIEGLARAKQTNSASIPLNSVRLTNLKTRDSASLLEHAGAARLLDRRGGEVLIVKPGDTVHLWMGAVDDLQAMSLDFIGWDGKPAKYFDRIDPRFRERYDAAFERAIAPNAPPEAMRDFLVEFAQRDPDKRAGKVFMALIQRMRAQNSFEGYYQSYLLLKEPADAKAAARLVQTEEHRTKMEAIAVATLVDKSRLLNLEVKLNPSSTRSDEGSCWMACNYNFKANRAISGTLTVSAKKTGSPIKLKMGSYKATFVTELTLPRWGRQSSFFLGSFDRRSDVTITRTVPVELRPPHYTASVPVQFGDLEIAFMQRGSAGGYTIYWATEDANLNVKFQTMELMK